MSALSRAILFGAMVCALAAPAVADTPVTVSPTSLLGPDLGKIEQGASVSVWSIDANTGTVTKTSGTAFRFTSGPSNPPIITINCTGNACKNSHVTVTFAASGASRATASGFRAGTVTSHGLTLQSSSGAGTTHFTMVFTASGTSSPSASFPLGMNVIVGASGPIGAIQYGYTVTAIKS